jgi:hypothetical protein
MLKTKNRTSNLPILREMTENLTGPDANYYLFKTFLESSSKIKVALIGMDLRVIYASQPWQKDLGDPNGAFCYDYFAGGIDQCQLCEAVKIISNGGGFGIIKELRDKKKYLNIYHPIENGDHRYIFVVSLEITDNDVKSQLYRMFKSLADTLQKDGENQCQM